MNNLQEMARITVGNNTYRTKNDLIAALYNDGYTASRAFEYIQRHASNSGITLASIASMYSRLRARDRGASLGLPVRPTQVNRPGSEGADDASEAPNDVVVNNDVPTQNIEPEAIQNEPEQEVVSPEQEISNPNNIEIPANIISSEDKAAYIKLVNALSDTGWVKINSPEAECTLAEVYKHPEYFAIVVVYLSSTGRVNSVNPEYPNISELIRKLEGENYTLAHNTLHETISKIQSKLNDINSRTKRINGPTVFRIGATYLTRNSLSSNIGVAISSAINPYLLDDAELRRQSANFFTNGQNVNFMRSVNNLIIPINEIITVEKKKRQNSVRLLKVAKTMYSTILSAVSPHESTASVFITYNAPDIFEDLDNTMSHINNRIPDTNNNYGHLTHVQNSDYLKLKNGYSQKILVFLRVRSFNFAIAQFELLNDSFLFGPYLENIELVELIKKLISPPVYEAHSDHSVFQALNTRFNTKRIPYTEYSRFVSIVHDYSDYIYNTLQDIYDYVASLPPEEENQNNQN